MIIRIPCRYHYPFPQCWGHDHPNVRLLWGYLAACQRNKSRAILRHEGLFPEMVAIPSTTLLGIVATMFPEAMRKFLMHIQYTSPFQNHNLLCAVGFTNVQKATTKVTLVVLAARLPEHPAQAIPLASFILLNPSTPSCLRTDPLITQVRES